MNDILDLLRSANNYLISLNEMNKEVHSMHGSLYDNALEELINKIEVTLASWKTIPCGNK